MKDTETRRIEVKSADQSDNARENVDKPLEKIADVSDRESVESVNVENNNNNNKNECDESRELSMLWKPVLACSTNVCLNTECACPLPHKIPGKEGYTCTNLISILLNGHNLFVNRMRKFKSNVFIMNLSGQRALLNDSKSVKFLFNDNIVEKEESFGFQVFNRAALDFYRPLIFQNGDTHRQNKTVLSEYMKYIKETYDVGKLAYLIAYEMDNLSMNTSVDSDFEDAAFLFVCNIITKVLLGSTLHYPHLKCWFRDCLVKRIYKPKLKKETENALKFLLEEIKTTPYFEKLRDVCENVINEDNLAREIIMMITVNAMGAVTNAFLSCIIYLSKISGGDKELLEHESMRFNDSKDTKDLFYTEGFVLEVLRLHPPAHKIFAIASQDFVIESETGHYLAPKGMLLCGNIYQTQRSESHFQHASFFDMKRFIDAPYLKKYLLSFGGSFDKPHDAPHHCLAQHLSITILKICVARLCTYNIEFRSEPYWSGSKYKRLAASDKPIFLKKFQKKEIPKKGKRMMLNKKMDVL